MKNIAHSVGISSGSADKILPQQLKGSMTLAMGKCLWFSVKIKVFQSSLSSSSSYPDLGTLWL